MKIGELVFYNNRRGKVVERKVHDIGWTSFTLYKVEFEKNCFEWINESYLKRGVFEGEE